MRHHHYRLTKRRFFKNKYKKKYVGCLIGVNCGLAEELLFEVDTAERIIDLSNALRAVVEIKSEDAQMAKFKAQDYQDGWDSCLEAAKQAIEKELG